MIDLIFLSLGFLESPESVAETVEIGGRKIGT